MSLKETYQKEVKSKLGKELGTKNVMAIPSLEKIIVNAGIGKEFRTNSQVVEEMTATVADITGQKPVVTNAKKAISNFKLREGQPNGIMVTLRGELMWNFLNKLIHIALPRVKDFRGVSATSFDGRGNYTLGIKEHTIFPEVDTTQSVKIRSLQIVIGTTAEDDKGGYELLKMLGMPFEKKVVDKKE